MFPLCSRLARLLHSGEPCFLSGLQDYWHTKRGSTRGSLSAEKLEQLLLVGRVLNVYRFVLAGDLPSQVVPSQYALSSLIIYTKRDRRIFHPHVFEDHELDELVSSLIWYDHVAAKEWSVLLLWNDWGRSKFGKKHLRLIIFMMVINTFDLLLFALLELAAR